MNLIKFVISQCPICQHIKHKNLPRLVKVHGTRGKLPEQIWQVDYIDQLT